MRTFGALLAGSAIATTLLATSAMAGGFQRGTADTDILFEPGTFSLRTGLTYVNPNRGFESINGQSGDYDDYTGNYTIPSFAVGFGGELFGCAGTFTESFAAEADYSDSPGGALPTQVASTQSISNEDRLDLDNATITSRTRTVEFDSDEFGATCRASYSNDMGRFSLLGGVFFEDFEFGGTSLGERSLNGNFVGTPLAAATNFLNGAGATLVLPTTVEVDSRGEYKAGYRLGFAYERPEIALRIQAMYRSEVEHDDVRGDGTVRISDTAFVRLADGTEVSVPTFFGGAATAALGPLVGPPTGAAIAAGIGANVPASGTLIPVASSLNTAISPQSLGITAQTGIAEGTLLLASLRWTDWSTNNAVVSTIFSQATGQSSSYAPYFWRDGYTASLGLGRAFSERVSGALAIGYDRGVSTGAETTYTDLYTVSGGVALKPDTWGEIRFGGLIGYWTDGDQSIDDGAYFNASVGDDWVYGANASLKVTW